MINGTNGMRSRRPRTSAIISALYHELAASHDLFAIEPDVEIAADAVDVCFGNPVGAGVLGVGMTKSDVHARNFFILQNVANDMCARCVGADCEFAHAIDVLAGAGVGANFIAQGLVLGLQSA